MMVLDRSTLLLFGLAASADACVALSSTSGPTMSNNNNGIAVIGCGVLGTSLCKQLLESPDFSDRQVIGITKTTNRHESILESVGCSSSDRFRVMTLEEVKDKCRFQDVVFCAPPSGFDDYGAAVTSAVTDLWSGPSEGGTGSFVFTSSGGVYGGVDGETVNETSETSDPESNPRTERLLKAERGTLQNGGCVLRLAGLYTLDRGAHNYWLTSGKEQIQGREDGILNLLHYDDAAGACVAALKATTKTTSGKIFLVSDGMPVTRKLVCESALKAKKYRGMTVPSFGGTGPKGKLYDGSVTNEALQWKPRYPSYDAFMASQQ